MKLLIAPMAALVETKAPMARARVLATEAVRRGHTVAFCAAEDPNYRAVEGVKNYYAPVPSPFGTPLWLGKALLGLGSLLGIGQRIAIRSFEQVLCLLGVTAKRFFARDVEAIRRAIRDFQPDLVYVEFRLAAVVAARLENCPIVTDYSRPVQPSFAASPEHSIGARSYLQQNGLPAVDSLLELFDWAELKFVGSSCEIEPLGGDNVIHVGPLEVPSPPAATSPGDARRVVAYVGTGILSPRRLRRVLIEAFTATPYELYIASQQLPPSDAGVVHVRSHFEFDALMPKAIVSIHHGGHNGVMKALLHGVPQIIVSGDHFERGYNADTVVRLRAGIKLAPGQFTAEAVRACVAQFASDPGYRARALAAGETLRKLGGAARVISILESRFPRESPGDQTKARGVQAPFSS